MTAIDYGKAGTNYGKTGTDYGKAGTNYGKTATNYGKAGTDYGKAATDYEKAGTDLIRCFELKSENFSDLRLFVLLFQLCFSKDFMNARCIWLEPKEQKVQGCEV